MSKYPASKAALIDEVHAGCKSTCIAADGFLHDRNHLDTIVKSHEDSLKLLTQSHYTLEEQVKAIARVLSSCNLPKMQEHIKLSQEEHARYVENLLRQKEKDIMEKVEREVAEISGAKRGLNERLSTMEQHILTTMGQAMEDARVVRDANKDNIEKLQNEMAKVNGNVEDNRKIINLTEYRFGELKRELRELESKLEAEAKTKDVEIDHKVQMAFDGAKEQINAESQVLAKQIQKRETLIMDEVKVTREQIEREHTNRVDESKLMNTSIMESMAKVKSDLEKKVGLVDTGMDHRVRSVSSSIQDAMRVIEEEATHRDLADKELARKIAKEINDRHQDDEKLVNLISTIQAAVAKMNHH